MIPTTAIPSLKLIHPILLMVFLGLWPIGAQAAGQDSIPDAGTISAGTTEVSFTVTEVDGQPVVGLNKDDIALKDNGSLKNINTLAFTRSLGEFMLLVDSSASIASQVRTIVDGATRFVNRMAPADEFSLVTFGEEVRSWVNPTSDRKVFEQGIAKMSESFKDSESLQQATNLDKAVWYAYDQLKNSDREQKIAILITDGIGSIIDRDRGELLKRLRSSGVLIYGIYVGEGTGGGFDALEAICKASGGLAVSAADSDPNKKFEQIYSLIKNSYRISYSPDTASAVVQPRFHRLDITVKGHPKYTVIAKSGFWDFGREGGSVLMDSDSGNAEAVPVVELQTFRRHLAPKEIDMEEGFNFLEREKTAYPLIKAQLWNNPLWDLAGDDTLLFQSRGLPVVPPFQTPDFTQPFCTLQQDPKAKIQETKDSPRLPPLTQFTVYVQPLRAQRVTFGTYKVEVEVLELDLAVDVPGVKKNIWLACGFPRPETPEGKPLPRPTRSSVTLADIERVMADFLHFKRLSYEE